MAVVSGLLYVAAPAIIVRHLVLRRTVDTQTLLGAIAAYLMLMAGMAFAFATLTTTGYGNLVPTTNPGQSLAVLEMLIGQLFLVTAVAKAVSSWRPSRGREHPLTEPDST
jgi:hypothetical protein